MEIRVATERDMPTLISMARVMHEESNFSPLPFDEKVTTETMRGLIRSRSGVVWLADDKQHTMGAICGQLSRAFFSQEIVAEDKAVFVRPQFRGASFGVVDQLLRKFCMWAAENGARRITICNSAGAPDEQFVHKLGSYNFKRAGSVMFMEVG
jgi:GNAT superfamily N-acetyltransferase